MRCISPKDAALALGYLWIKKTAMGRWGLPLTESRIEEV
jgi:hypothetical protein